MCNTSSIPSYGDNSKKFVYGDNKVVFTISFQEEHFFDERKPERNQNTNTHSP
jgi:hypothetical protein